MRHHLRFLLFACFASAAATAATVPLTVRVSNGDAVQSIELAGDTGLIQLTRSPDGSSFAGTIEINASGTTLQSIVISYADFGYPVLLRVHEHLPRVEFPVKARLPTSCTNSQVSGVEDQAMDLGTAISWSIQAARLASIKGNDRCDAALRARSIAAKFRNARRMAQLSQGLFVVPEELIAECKSQCNSTTVLAELNRYPTEALELQAVQLVALRDEARDEGNFGKAAAIQQTIAYEAETSDTVEKAFANVGVDKDRIADDSAYLSSMARDEVQTERPN
jgi:hypothetical protein